MIIDTHVHTFPDAIAPAVIQKLQAKAASKAYTDGTDRALERSMSRAGIDISILLPVATNTAQVHKLNEIAIAKNEHFPESGLLSLGAMHPDFENYKEELNFLAVHGIKGIKLHPAYQGVDLDDTRYLRIIEKASELGLAIVIHAGLDIGIMHHNFSSTEHILKLIRMVAPEKLVLAHMGGWKCWDSVEHDLCGAPVYFDTSFSFGSYTPPEGTAVPPQKTKLLSKEQFRRIIQKHGSDKILFGTDCPWSEQKRSVEELLSCGFCESENKQIFSDNAKKVFDI